MIALALCAAFLFGTGLCAAALPRPLSRALVLVLGAALGLAAFSASYAASLFLFGADSRVRLAKDALLAAVGAFLLWRHREGLAVARAASPRGAEVPRWLWALFACAAVVACALFIEHSLRFPDGGWDAWMIWNLRARALARAGAGFKVAFSQDNVFWAHQDYPLLVPGLVAQSFLLTGSESVLIPVGVAWSLATLSVALLTVGLAKLRGLRWGLLAGLALLATPSFVSFAANQQSDVPMGLFVLCACSALALALEQSREPKLLLLAGAAASTAAWTKNEGSLYLLALLLALAFVPRALPLRARARDAALFLAGALPVLLLLALFKLEYAHTNDLVHFTSSQTALERATDLHRWGELLFAWLRRIVYFQDWALFLLAEVLALLFVVPRLPWRPSTRVLGAALALAVCAWVPMYILQPHPLLWFFRASIDRLTNHLWPSILLVTFLALSAPLAAPNPTAAKR